MEKLSQGAEAVIYRHDNEAIKERSVKSYRLPEIDESLRKSRTRREAKVISKLNLIGVSCPKLNSSCDKKMQINMEYIDGAKLRDCLSNNPEAYSQEIGAGIAKMHANDIIHGDLTTSNMILKNDKVYFIDFGLSFFSKKIEDKAVDLHLLKRALESKHNGIYEECFRHALDAYSGHYPDAKEVLKKLEAVEKRGRNKSKE